MTHDFSIFSQLNILYIGFRLKQELFSLVELQDLAFHQPFQVLFGHQFTHVRLIALTLDHTCLQYALWISNSSSSIFVLGFLETLTIFFLILIKWHFLLLCSLKLRSYSKSNFLEFSPSFRRTTFIGRTILYKIVALFVSREIFLFLKTLHSFWEPSFSIPMCLYLLAPPPMNQVVTQGQLLTWVPECTQSGCLHSNLLIFRLWFKTIYNIIYDHIF